MAPAKVAVLAKKGSGASLSNSSATVSVVLAPGGERRTHRRRPGNHWGWRHPLLGGSRVPRLGSRRSGVQSPSRPAFIVLTSSGLWLLRVAPGVRIPQSGVSGGYGGARDDVHFAPNPNALRSALPLRSGADRWIAEGPIFPRRPTPGLGSLSDAGGTELSDDDRGGTRLSPAGAADVSLDGPRRMGTRRGRCGRLRAARCDSRH